MSVCAPVSNDECAQMQCITMRLNTAITKLTDEIAKLRQELKPSEINKTTKIDLVAFHIDDTAACKSYRDALQEADKISIIGKGLQFYAIGPKWSHSFEIPFTASLTLDLKS